MSHRRPTLLALGVLALLGLGDLAAAVGQVGSATATDRSTDYATLE